jgi:hypothetical protein
VLLSHGATGIAAWSAASDAAPGRGGPTNRRKSSPFGAIAGSNPRGDAGCSVQDGGPGERDNDRGGHGCRAHDGPDSGLVFTVESSAPLRESVLYVTLEPRAPQPTRAALLHRSLVGNV